MGKGCCPLVGTTKDFETLSTCGCTAPSLPPSPGCKVIDGHQLTILSDRSSLTCCFLPCFLEFSRTSGFHLIPSPPKYPMPPESGISSLGRSTDLPFRGRRLRVLGSLGPSLGEGSVLGERLAAVTALRALEVSSGPSHRAQGCPDPKPALGPAACPSGLHCLHHLNPIPPAHSLP